jgi:antitoxin (DNA-binding transcriptional repressor) of toxin-antitoxin stability system
MKTATTHYAKTHLSRLIKDVQHGETVIILHGTVPAAKLTAVGAEHAPTRPKSGTATSAPTAYAADAFTPLTDDQLKEWGL